MMWLCGWPLDLCPGIFNHLSCVLHLWRLKGQLSSLLSNWRDIAVFPYLEERVSIEFSIKTLCGRINFRAGRLYLRSIGIFIFFDVFDGNCRKRTAAWYQSCEWIVCKRKQKGWVSQHFPDIHHQSYNLIKYKPKMSKILYYLRFLKVTFGHNIQLCS